MMMALQNFLNMGGYGFYVWSAYGCVLAFLLAQWFIPWRRWKHTLRQGSNKDESHP